MGQLSDGQKSRVVLAKMAKESPHLLLLDEPTNHLDMESIDSLAKAINSFTGGMILVSHDMRLISQVAKEIWLCDNRTVAKYLGDISDFKMQLRAQIHNNLEGGGKKTAAAEMLVAPLVPKKMSLTADSNVPIPAIAPLKPSSTSTSQKVATAPPVPPSRKEESTSGKFGNDKDDGEDEGFGDEEDEAKRKAEEKALAKAKKKAEKEAAAALAKQEEEERQRRREEKLREAEEAKKLKELERQRKEEFERQKQLEEVSSYMRTNISRFSNSSLCQ
jgi:hypothetical protein